ncbi:beta strand repeat-containing protein [Pseudolysobacter antarcticus]|uniref:beta strand repeat-containing protein n=1 Tax=Pseudolysobacter antarcticus TaxID=2511995 RepID=UPI0013EC860D|nr:Ig-like domain-containing protein [Pseudolysobacter antarcticus]
MAFSVASYATPIAVPNGGFTSTTNANPVTAIGGGLLTPSAQGVAIGTTGPWTGSYSGALGLVAPPTLQISATAHTATIGGILGLNVAGSLVANSASFDQVFPTGDPANLFRASKVYTLNVNVDTPSIVGLNVLGESIIGSALTSTSGVVTTTVANSNANPAILTLLSSGHYTLSLPYTTPASGGAVGSQIGVSLYSHPQGLAQLNLIQTIAFSNATMTRVGTVPSSIVVTVGSQSGSQSAVVGDPFAHPLSVTVVDSDGDAVPGVNVTFTVPGSGAGANLAPASTVVTGADGTAVVNATANTLPGGYVITAQVGGVPTPAIFNLTNVAGPPFAITVLPPPPTSATVGTPFAPLNVQVTDKFGNPVADGISVTVTATTAASGASTQTTTMVTTTAGGQAQINESANNIIGSYTLTVTAGAATSSPISLTNAPGVPIKVKPGVGGNAAASGTPQSATIAHPFGTALSVLVTDQFDNPVAGAVVTFTLPASGAGATLSANPVTTDANGVATVTATANNLAGLYHVPATVAGGTQTTTFDLTNNGVTGIGGGTPQVAVVSADFGCALIATVTDGNGPVAGVGVQFVANASPAGASAGFSSLQGSQNTSPLTITTDANGSASVVAKGNAIAGDYTATAGIPGAGQTVTYKLSNLAQGERIFANGFEDPSSTCAH